MSVSAVQARIAQIQQQFGAAAPTGALGAKGTAGTTGAAGTSGVPADDAGFAGALASAQTEQGTAAAPQQWGTSLTGASQPGVSTTPAAPTRAVHWPHAAAGEPPLSGQQVVTDAKQYLGVPYVWGGEDPRTGLDCSGLVQRTFADLGVRLPRTADEQAHVGTPVASLAQARPGDLVVFNYDGAGKYDHIGIYLGGGKMIHAPVPGQVVQVADVGHPDAIRRIVPSTPPTSAVGSLGASGTSLDRYDALFNAAGARHGVPAALLKAVGFVESHGDPNAVSPAGALGLMQFMPGTAAGLGIDPRDPAQAIDGAARLLAQNLRAFGSVDLAVAAYNAGAGAVRAHGGVPDNGETPHYVDAVRRAWESFR